jgi:predicted TIM-barrel fold metal-dependent hydrolase
MIPTWRVEESVAEVGRIASMGLAAAMLPLVGTPDYNHRQWQPLWRAIEETGLPVVMHQGSGHDMLFYRGPGASVANLLATQSMAPRTAGLLATSGVLAAHPDLHFVFVETNAGWLSWAMSTVDYYYEAFQQYEGWVKPLLADEPSTFMARQIHGTFQYDPVALNAIGITGTDALLWGSDFPHAEGTYPDSRATVAQLFAGVPIEQAAAIVGGTASRLFGFADEVLSTPP